MEIMCGRFLDRDKSAEDEHFCAWLMADGYVCVGVRQVRGRGAEEKFASAMIWSKEIYCPWPTFNEFLRRHSSAMVVPAHLVERERTRNVVPLYKRPCPWPISVEW